jgi:hypothetical protein
VRQVGYLQRLYRGAGSTEHTRKISSYSLREWSYPAHCLQFFAITTVPLNN